MYVAKNVNDRAECERSFSTLQGLKTYLRGTMTSELESGLALIHFNYGNVM